jgi:hypothetical protein
MHSANALSNPLGKYGSRLGKLIAGLLLAALLLITVLSGWISLHEGMSRFLWPFTLENSTEFATEKLTTLRAEPSGDAIRALSIELWGLSQLTSVERFVDSRLPDHGMYYATMPWLNQALLLVHVLLAAFCMLFGGLQFWPSFRKRYMRIHRLIGTIYVITVPPAVLTSLIYLALTPPHHIYDHLVAWVALWAFGALGIISVIMAVLAIRARRLHEHQAWMALSFGCLLVAPLLRWNWVWLAWIFPGIDQETLNLVTMGAMLPECIFITYFLILLNRQYERRMVNRPVHVLAAGATQVFLCLLPAFYVLSTLLAAATLHYFFMKHGMKGHEWYTTLVSPDLINQEHSVLMAQSVARYGLALGLSLGLPSALYVLGQLLRVNDVAHLSFFSRTLAVLTAITALLAGIAASIIGWHIGIAPDNLLFSGGTLYTVNGTVIVALALFNLFASLRGHLALMKESLTFLLAMLPFPTLFLASSWALHQIGLPPEYLAAGQGFVLPVGLSTSLLFLAILHVIYNQATREHN